MKATDKMNTRPIPIPRRLVALALLLTAACQDNTPAGPAIDELDDTVPADSVFEAVNFNPAYTPRYAEAITGKNFFFLTQLAATPEARTIVHHHEVWQALAATYETKLQQAATACNGDPDCYYQAFRITQTTSAQVVDALEAVAQKKRFVNFLINQHLRPSGCYMRNAQADDVTLTTAAWQEAAGGINHLLEVYLLGEAPKDAVSDGPYYTPDDPAYQDLLATAVYEMEETLPTEGMLFFEPSLQFARRLLQIHHRDEAARYEPLGEGENKAALNSIPTIDWAQYTYGALVVLGDSPNSPGDAENLSESAKHRVALAADNYAQGRAPFILFTGANVYPNFTTYHEAIEMKRYLLEHFDVPEAAVMVDPHARHTTTNLRNAARLWFRYGLPTNKQALIVATQAHIDLVVSADFGQAILRELKYRPYTQLVRESLTTASFLPVVTALDIDPYDPLDP